MYPLTKSTMEKTNAELAKRFFDKAPAYLVAELSHVPEKEWPVNDIRNAILDVTEANELARKHYDRTHDLSSEFHTYDDYVASWKQGDWKTEEKGPSRTAQTRRSSGGRDSR